MFDYSSTHLLERVCKTAALAKLCGATVFGLISVTELEWNDRYYIAEMLEKWRSFDFPMLVAEALSGPKFIEGTYWVSYWMQLCHQERWAAVGFESLKRCGSPGALAMVGDGCSFGKNRAENAVREALSSGLLHCDAPILSAKGVLVRIEGASITKAESELITGHLKEVMSKDALIINGVQVNDQSGDKLWVKLFFIGV